MTDDQFLLANAYFDNEVDPRERIQAESDPIVMAEVDRLRTLRHDLRDVPPASAATRASAIEAALAAWTTTSSSSSPASTSSTASRATSTSTASSNDSRSSSVTPPTSLDSARAHRSSSRWAAPSRLLGAAAALVAIGFGAFVVTRGDGGEAGDAVAGATESSSYSYETADSAAEFDDDDASASAMADEASDSALTPAVTVGGGANLADTQTPSVENTPPSTTAPGSAGGAPPVTVTPLSTLQFTDDDLQILVDQFVERPGGNRAPPITYDCNLATPDTANVVGYTNVLNRDNDRPTVTLFIMVDHVDQYAYAVDADTCLVVRALVLRP